MNPTTTKQTDVQLPAELEQQLYRYRHSVWRSKILETIAIAVVLVLLAFLAVFILDRFLDSPQSLRFTCLAIAVLGVLVLPFGVYRWVWSRRLLSQVARLISQKMPDAGDRLLGVLELVDNSKEQQRSPELCHAAIKQVASEAKHWNLPKTAIPGLRKSWVVQAVLLSMITVFLALLVPAASQSSWSRLLNPLKAIPRYSFAELSEVPSTLIAAHGEPFSIELALSDESLWKPATGRLVLGSQTPLEASLKKEQYLFDVPAQTNSNSAIVRIGDARHEIQIEPTLRPELTDVIARFKLPEYLQRTKEIERDVRGGSMTLVAGTRVSLFATANRELTSAKINGLNVEPKATQIASVEKLIDDSCEIVFEWTDNLGLQGKQPFSVSIIQTVDEPPSLSCLGLSRQKVVLVSEQLKFDIQARDDFGIREIGIEWSGFNSDDSPADLMGERVLAAGDADREVINATGAFTAKNLGIEPQPISLRIYAEDFKPGRERAYSVPYLLYVLTPDQHAIWITEQLSKWHRRALEVRDREMQLYQINKELHDLSQESLQLEETRKLIDRQANAERANGRRLSNLNQIGEELVLQATRNPEIGVGHLEEWAEMLQLLKEISANRMPSVAKLLKEASQAPAMAAASSNTPIAGVDLGEVANTKSLNSEENDKKSAGVPQIVDRESSQQPLESLASSEPKKKAASTPSLKLPMTTLIGQAKPNDDSEETPSIKKKMDTALTEQRDLLAEFERIANELNNVLATLEGSSLVKRLKSASRKQYSAAGEIGELIESTFGFATLLDKSAGLSLVTLSKKVDDDSQTVSYILDDMQAYFERRPFARFRTVIDEMKEADIVGNLSDLSEEIPSNQGLSIAQCEFWSDSLDRWAENLVDPACSGTCPGCKSPGSLPPSIILEAMKILEGEINLREETRIAEQAKPAINEVEHSKQANQLAEAQLGLQKRTEDLVPRIQSLQDGASKFAKEIALLTKVATVMKDACQILAKPDTGADSIAAETEAIELLLQSKRINPKGGGGGGSNPGGGGGGNTTDSAIALLGKGVNQKEIRVQKKVQHSTGVSSSNLPREFRSGLDEYFNRIVEPEG